MTNRYEKTLLTIVYDNRTLETEFYTDWGVSVHLKRGEKEILFDVGNDKNILTHNMKKLGVRMDDIDIIVISHSHWDHFGGLSAFEDKDVKIFIPQSSAKRIKDEFDLTGEVISVSNRTDIIDGIHSTGELGHAVREQSLLVQGKDGLYILTGCGHPGIENIIDIALESGDPKGIIGGYHGFRDIEKLEGIPLLVPCHCTMFIDKIEEAYPEAYRECGVGFSIEI